MSTDSIASSDHQSRIRLQSRTRRKSREVTSRYLSTSPNTSLSPVRHKQPVFDKTNRLSLDDPAATKALWPSSAASSLPGSKKLQTLAEHLNNLSLKDREHLFLTRQKSCSEISRFECGSTSSRNTKENYKPVLAKLKLNIDKSSPSPSASGSGILPGRLSVDENALNRSRRSSSFISNKNVIVSPYEPLDSDWCTSNDSESSAAGVRKTASFSSCMSSTTASTSRGNNGIHVFSKFMQDSAISSGRLSNASVSKTKDSPKQMRKSILISAMRRANSLTGYGSVTSQWALSPGRTSSSMVSIENKEKLLKTYSNLKPPTSPQKSAKGVEKFLSIGMDLFKTKKSSSSSQVISAGSANAEGTHKLLYCRLMQWRFANAKAQVTCENVAKQSEMNLIFAQESLVRLQHSVTRKRLKYQRESLLWKLNVILRSQMKILETWGEIERQHTSAVSMTKDYLLAFVCKVPLIEGAKANTQLASLTLRHASDLTASMMSMLTAISPLAGETSVLLSELAKVVAQENFLMEECLEMCKTISLLEVQEWSSRSNQIQLARSQHIPCSTNLRLKTMKCDLKSSS